LHMHSVCVVWAVVEAWWTQPEPFFCCELWKEVPAIDLYVAFAINCFIKTTQAQQFFLHLQHIRNQLSLDGAGLRGFK
jgi:hypothetical protein